MTSADIAATLSCRPMGQLFASTPGGWINSVAGLKNGITITLVVASISFLGAALSTSIVGMQLSLVSLGVGEEWYQLGLHTLLSINIRPDMRGRGMGVLGLCRSVAGVTGPILFAYLSVMDSQQENIGVLSMASMVFVALILHLCLLPVTKGRLSGRRRATASTGLGSTNTKKNGKNLFCQVYHKHSGDFARSVPFLSGIRALKQGNYMLTALICLSAKYSLSDIALVTATMMASAGLSSQLGAYMMVRLFPG